MSYETIIRAWKNEAYRNSLSAEELVLLPANPAGAIELTDADLAQANGGMGTGGKCGRNWTCTFDTTCAEN